VTAVEPKPAASVLLVRDSAPGAPEPLEVYMIRRQKTMRFLGGFYAFPGGKVDAADSAPEALARCRGVDSPRAEAIVPASNGVPSLAYWVTAVRELLEETGLLLGCDDNGRPADASRAETAGAILECRKAVMSSEPFAALLAERGWHMDLRPLRYLSHFVTPKTSPIRFSARFFLCPVPAGQSPQLFTEETSEGFWIHPGEGYRRFLSDDMAMAEPAEYALAYLAQFASLDDVWAAHADGREKFHGIVHRIEFWHGFDWKHAQWNRPKPRSG
jgi:8-oxo-dGTP pyrophosphatase MutT (NUDIX family)